MSGTIEAEILKAEERLSTAMLSSDAAALDELLAAELIFTNHLGQMLGKEDDLSAYRSGMLRVEKLEASEQHLRLLGDAAVVSVRVKVTGTYGGQPANGDFRFTRVWTLSSGGSWHVIAAHAGMVS